MFLRILLVLCFVDWAKAFSLTARIHEGRLKLISTIGREIAENAIRTSNLHLDYDSYHMRDFDWRRIELPKTNISVTDDMLHVTAGGGLITARCHAVVTYKGLKFVSFSKAGDIEFLLSGLNTAVSLRANNETGEVEVASCHADLAKVEIQRVHGDALNHLLNIPALSKWLARHLRQKFNDLACNVAAEKISMFNSWVFPVTKDRHKIFTVEYGALKIKPADNALAATADITFHYGNGQKCQANFSQKMVTSELKVLAVGFAEPVAQCLLKASHESKSLWYRVNTTDPEISSYFRTTCALPKVCIGLALPEMSEKYPNKTVDVMIFASKAPEINVISGVVSIAAYTTFNVTINSTLVCQINFDVVIDLQKPYFKNNHFYLLPTVNYVSLKVVNSIVGYPNIWIRWLPPWVLKWLLNNEGYKFWLDGYNLTNYHHDTTEINLLRGYVDVGLDFSNETLVTENLHKPTGYLPYWLMALLFCLNGLSSILAVIFLLSLFFTGVVFLPGLALRWWHAAPNQEEIALLELDRKNENKLYDQ